MEIKLYERLPEVIEAVQLSPYNYKEVESWVGGLCSYQYAPLKIKLTVPNVEGNQSAYLRSFLKEGNDTPLETSRLYYLADVGRLSEFEQLDYLEWQGDFIVKRQGRFSVVEYNHFYKLYTELSV